MKLLPLCSAALWLLPAIGAAGRRRAATAAGADGEREAQSKGSRNKTKANKQKKKSASLRPGSVTDPADKWSLLLPAVGSSESCDPYDPSCSPSVLLLAHYSQDTHTYHTHTHSHTGCNSHCCDSKQHPSCAHNAPLRGEGGEKQRFIQYEGNINTMWSKRCGRSAQSEEGSLNAPPGVN